MDYEKLYKETIDKLRKLHNDWNSTQNRAAKEIELVIPELRESEDERIMKEIISYIKSSAAVTNKDWIAWLEKQGEQHNVWNVEDEHNLKAALGYIEDEYLRRWFKDIVYAKFEKQDEQRSWSEEDENLYTWCVSAITTRYNDGLFTTSEYKQTKLWLKSLKDRVQPQLKQEWSEEDGKMFNEVILDLTRLRNKDSGEEGKSAYQREIDWLESLKLKSFWKPSEQNIKDLEWCADLVKDKMGVGFHRLQVFVDEIKKL